MNDPAQAPEGAAELLVRDEGRVRCIVLNRPHSKNGLTTSLLAQLTAALREAGLRAAEGSVRAVLLSGASGNFCSGADLRAGMSLAQQGGGAALIEETLRTYYHGTIRALRHVNAPVIAFIDGAAVGFGCDLALACDLRVGTPGARIGEIFVKRGLMPDGGGTYTLPRIVGLGRALEMMMLGEIVDGERAERIGLFNRVVASEAEALALAQRLAAGPPVVLRRIKEAVYSALDGDLEAALETEARGQIQLLQSEDFFEGLSAFFMKREPDFKGR